GFEEALELLVRVEGSSHGSVSQGRVPPVDAGSVRRYHDRPSPPVGHRSPSGGDGCASPGAAPHNARDPIHARARAMAILDIQQARGSAPAVLHGPALYLA